MLRKIIIVIDILAAFLLQTTFHDMMTIGGIAPNLLLAVVCCLGFIQGKKTGMYVGFISGLFLDIFFGYAGVIGFTALTYMYLGYVNGLFHEIYYSDDICIPVLLTVTSDFAYNFIYYCVTFLLRGKLDMVHYIRTIMFPEMIYTGLVTVFVFRILIVIHMKLEKFEKRGEEKIVKGDL